MTTGRSVALLTCAILVELTVGTRKALASPIGLGGFDLFATDPSISSVTIPAGTLPGQLAAISIPIRGIPILPLTDVDTIVERQNAVAIPSGGVGAIPIELVALYLGSQSSMVYPAIGPADLYVTLNQLGLPGIPQPIPRPPSAGTYTITLHNDLLGSGGGGTFSASLNTFVDLVFTVPGGDPNVPADQLVTGTSDAFGVSFGGIWSHTPGPDDPHTVSFPAAGFFPGVDPVTGAETVILEQATPPTFGLLPAQTVPEPSTLVLLALGLGGGAAKVAFVRRRANRH